jgi:outer membrane protein
MNRICTTVLTLLVASSVLSAQPKTLTLKQAIELALEKNISVVQAQNNVDAANASLLAARGEYLPSLTASAGWSRSQVEDRGFPRVVRGGYSAGIDTRLTIFDGLRREAGLSSASANASVIERRSARARQSAAYQVEVGYLSVLRGRQLVLVSEENLKRDGRQLERITESNKVGASSLADVYRQQSQVAKDELDVINSSNSYNKSRADLLAFIGADASDEYEIADASLVVDAGTANITAPADEYREMAPLTRRAFAARPDYLGIVESYDAADAGITAARSGYFPSLSAFAGYSLANEKLSNLSDNRSMDWGLSLSWTLFDKFQTNRALQQASVETRNAEIAIRQAGLDISAEVKKTMLDLEASRKALDVTQKGLRSAEEDRRIAEERYNLGAGTLLDLLVANANLVTAEAARINATYDFFIALRTMEFVLGERTY